LFVGGALELFDGGEDFEDLAVVETLVAMEGEEESVLVEHPPDGHLGVAGVEAVGVGFEAVAVRPVQFAVAGGEDQAVIELAEGGVFDVGGVAEGASVVSGLGFGGHPELLGIEVVLAGVLRRGAFAGGRAGAGGFAGVGAIGGDAALGDLGEGHGQAAFRGAERMRWMMAKRRRWSEH
jgi:hypothetical protein